MIVPLLVDVDLSDIDLEDLQEELESRGELPQSIRGIISGLKKQACPPEIIARLEEWAAIPVVDSQKLKQWKAFAGNAIK